MRKKVLCLLVLIGSSALQSTVILVHGTFGSQSQWCQPGGGFYNELAAQAHILGHQVVPFVWSGRNSNSARLTGAQALAKMILNLTPATPRTLEHTEIHPAQPSRISLNCPLTSELFESSCMSDVCSALASYDAASITAASELILIGHSHGGNVITIASQLLAHPLELVHATRSVAARIELDNFFALPPHVQAHCLDTARGRILAYINAKEYTVIPWQAHCILTQLELHAHATRALSSDKHNTHTNSPHAEYQRALSITTFERIPTPRPHIARAYLLATPVHEKYYAPNMNVIGELYNLYSPGDLVQRVLGLYHRRFKNTRNTHNILVTQESKSDGKLKFPGHHDLHLPEIGRCILHFPQQFEPDILAKPQQHPSHRKCDGVLHIDRAGVAHYQVIKEVGCGSPLR